MPIDVWDGGSGIPQNRQQDIFEEFVQLHNPERARGNGLGLGLAIVERVARLLDCPHAQSAGGDGDCVWSLPGCAALAQLSAAPSVLLCDYRLRDGETWLDVIQMFHGAFGTAIPAVLITGDTAPGSVRAIKASGHALLYKPVRPAKLRALLSKMLPHL